MRAGTAARKTPPARRRVRCAGRGRAELRGGAGRGRAGRGGAGLGRVAGSDAEVAASSAGILLVLAGMLGSSGRGRLQKEA